MTEEQSTMLLEQWCERNCKEICSNMRPCYNCVVTFIKQTLDINNRQKVELERLKAEIKNTDNILNSLDRPLVEVEYKAIKDFAERLKSKKQEVLTSVNVGEYAVTESNIDNLVKEMTEGNHDE